VTIRLEHIFKSFGPVPVLKDIHLEFPEKAFVTLVGPSGCGKTTLLRILAGLESATSGAIWHGAERVSDLAPGKRDVAMVFQSYALYPHMDVRSNIGYGLKVRGVPREERDRRVLEVARVLEIEQLLGRKPRQLSGGQRQRVALGRAMVRKPWLYVTHDQLEAMTLSDLIAVMDHGVVQQYATPAEIYNRPANTFVAGFIGSPPMNFIDGARIGGGAVAIPAGDRVVPVAASTLAPGADRPVRLGVRPQDVRLDAAGAPGTVSGEVTLVQLVGSEQLVDLELGGRARVTAEVKADVLVEQGARVGVSFDPARLHLFDAESGRNLDCGPGHA
jgi:ABC-type sugar transport system ATPase subunit